MKFNQLDEDFLPRIPERPKMEDVLDTKLADAIMRKKTQDLLKEINTAIDGILRKSGRLKKA